MGRVLGQVITLNRTFTLITTCIHLTLTLSPTVYAIFGENAVLVTRCARCVCGIVLIELSIAGSLTTYLKETYAFASPTLEPTKDSSINEILYPNTLQEVTGIH